jgi:hypothetical protein
MILYPSWVKTTCNKDFTETLPANRKAAVRRGQCHQSRRSNLTSAQEHLRDPKSTLRRIVLARLIPLLALSRLLLDGT